MNMHKMSLFKVTVERELFNGSEPVYTVEEYILAKSIAELKQLYPGGLKRIKLIEHLSDSPVQIIYRGVFKVGFYDDLNTDSMDWVEVPPTYLIAETFEDCFSTLKDKEVLKIERLSTNVIVLNDDFHDVDFYDNRIHKQRSR